MKNRMRPITVRPENLLLLVPHCLQRSICSCNIIHDADRCERCGHCNVSDMLTLRDEFGIRCCLVSGGRQAAEMAAEPNVKAIVAVACEKELVDGIRAAGSKPVIAISNEQPNGPCRDTCVNMESVRAAIRRALGKEETD